MRVTAPYSPSTVQIGTDDLGGLDIRRQGEALSFEEMENMSVSRSPFLVTREKRTLIEGSRGATSVISLDYRRAGEIVRDALFCDFSTRLKAYKDGVFTNILSYRTPRDKRRLVVNGATLYIFPEKLQVDLMDYASSSPLECQQTMNLGNYQGYWYELVLGPCHRDGTDSPQGDYTKIERHCYTEDRGAFVQKMAFNNGFSVGDFAEFTGDAALEGTRELVKISTGRTYMVLPGSVSKTVSSGQVIISRTLPEMDIIISAKNRLWGCRYGIDKNGDSVNAIYASAPGDGRNWRRFDGGASDSYALSLGSPGAFTAAAVLDGEPVFFKKDRILKIAGDYPSRFTLCEYTLPGVAEDARDSLARIGNALYYKSPEGVMRFCGGTAEKIDAPIGGETYCKGSGGRRGECYCISMEKDGEYSFFVYDTEKKLWAREDGTCALGLAHEAGKSYLLTSGGLYLCGGEDKEIRWSLVTAPIKLSGHMAACRVRLYFKDRVESVRLGIEYDDGGVFSETQITDKRRDGSLCLRLVPRRSRWIRLKIQGIGRATFTGVRVICRKFK